MAAQKPLMMPTGLSSLDPVLEGGIPQGSVVLLLADIGAGNREFVHSSVLSISSPDRKAGPGEVLPSGIRYVTFTKKKDDILQEITLSFHPDLARGLGQIQFIDLSEQYFDSSIVPVRWYSQENLVDRLQRHRETGSVLGELTAQLEKGGRNVLFVLDSLTEIGVHYAATPRWNELTAFLRGLQRVTKDRDSTVYLLLTRGILDPQRELEIADTADAVILFRWEETTGMRRQRVMYFEKFRGLMPHLEENDLVKFAVRITAGGGFEVSNIRVVI
ncbi:MAG: hypothetical protein LUQ25_05590 [Methanoregulaceae archaeon]|nr:hypothetical protein [Methanoregulaceae archaeon]